MGLFSGGTNKLFVVIGAKVTDFDRGMSKVEGRLRKTGDEFSRIGSELTIGVTAPLVAFGALSARSAIQYETAFTGVLKTTEDATNELGELTEVGISLRQGFRDLAKEIPVSAVELARIGEAAGQLGVKSEDVLEFTEVMAGLGVTTNLSSDEAATALARFASIIDNEAGPQFDRLGSTIVGLGNNFETTEQEIVTFGLRIAATGNLIGLSEAEILSFGAALSSVGVPAERGGTAINKVFTKIFEAVQTGGEALESFASTSGVSVESFRQHFEEDAAGAVASFIVGLQRIVDEEGNVFEALREVELQDERLKQSILSLAGAGTKLTDSLKQGTTDWEENIALTREQELRFKTAESQLKIFGQRINDVGITLGNVFVPMGLRLLDMLDPVIKLIDKGAVAFAKLPTPIQNTAVALVALVAAVGPLSFIFGQLLKSGAALTSLVGSSGALGLLGKTLKKLGTITPVVSKGLIGSGKAATTASVGFSMAAVKGQAATAVFGQIRKTAKPATQVLSSVGAAATVSGRGVGKFSGLLGKLGAKMPRFAGLVGKGSLATKALGLSMAVVTGPIGLVVTAIALVGGAILTTTGTWGEFFSIAKSVGSILKSVVVGTFKQLAVVVKGVTGAIGAALGKLFDFNIGSEAFVKLMQDGVKWASSFADSMRVWASGTDDASRAQSVFEKQMEGTATVAGMLDLRLGKLGMIKTMSELEGLMISLGNAGRLDEKTMLSLATQAGALNKKGEELSVGLGRIVTLMDQKAAATKKAERVDADAAKAAEEHADQLKNLADKLGGKGVVGAANLWIEALDEIGGLSKLTRGEQAEVNATLREAIDKYQALGKSVPIQWSAISLATEAAANELDAYGGMITDLSKVSPFTLFGIALPTVDMFEIFKDLKMPPGLPEGFGQNFGERVLTGIQDTMTEKLGSTIMAAITGGGDIAKAVGGLLGQSIGESLSDRFGETLTNTFGKTFGGILNSMLPGIGTLIGSGIGKLGSAIGSGIKSLFGGRSVERNIELTVERQWGQSISKGLQSAIAADAKTIGHDMSAILVNLGSIFDEVGGVAEFGFAKATRATRDLFSMLDSGTLTASQVGAALQEIFPKLVAEIDKATPEGRAAFNELISLADQFGIKVEAIDDFVLGVETDEAEAAFKVTEEAAEAARLAVEQLASQMAALDAALPAIAAKATALLAPFEALKQSKAFEELGEDAETLIKDTEAWQAALAAGQVEFETVGVVATAAFAGMVSGGTSVLDALGKMGSTIETLTTGVNDLGFTSTVAIDDLLRMNEVVTANKAVFASIQANQDILSAFGDAGILTTEIFNRLGTDTAASFATLIDKGVGANEAMALMQPTLQSLWEGQERFGDVTDEATASLLAQAEEQGIVGAQMKDVNERILDVLVAIGEALGATLPQALGTFSEAATDAGDSILAKNKEISDSIRTQLPTDLSVLKDGFKRASDDIGISMDEVRGKLEQIGSAAESASAKAQGALDSIHAPDIEFNITGNLELPRLPAGGGFELPELDGGEAQEFHRGRLASNEVSAILLDSEAVLNPHAAQTLGADRIAALNAGGDLNSDQPIELTAVLTLDGQIIDKKIIKTTQRAADNGQLTLNTRQVVERSR